MKTLFKTKKLVFCLFIYIYFIFNLFDRLISGGMFSLQNVKGEYINGEFRITFERFLDTKGKK